MIGVPVIAFTFRRFTSALPFWCLCGWLGPIGLCLQVGGVYYVSMLQALDGLILLTIGTVCLVLAAAVGILAFRFGLLLAKLSPTCPPPNVPS